MCSKYVSPVTHGARVGIRVCNTEYNIIVVEEIGHTAKTTSVGKAADQHPHLLCTSKRGQSHIYAPSYPVACASPVLRSPVSKSSGSTVIPRTPVDTGFLNKSYARALVTSCATRQQGVKATVIVDDSVSS